MIQYILPERAKLWLSDNSDVLTVCAIAAVIFLIGFATGAVVL
jgi:hypothetical protein